MNTKTTATFEIYFNADSGPTKEQLQDFLVKQITNTLFEFDECDMSIELEID